MSRLRGRFSGEVDDEVHRVTSSLDLDGPIAGDDITGSVAHVAVLERAGLLTSTEADTLRQGLARISDELASGDWRPDRRHDDIHMAVEARLTELVGEVAGKLHTARSRNDQVATAVRLWLRRSLAGLDHALADLVGVLLDRVESDGRTLMPGYTHQQRAQPVLLGHHLLAHAWALQRDRGRVADAAARADACPLGACALAGTGHPIDRELAAELLGFSRVTDNAMDSVAARDHLQEAAAAAAIAMATMSRMAEELVLWCSAEIRFVRLGDDVCTGSSIMPQKRNPDPAELVRGKAGRVFGALQALLCLVKGLPLAYSRDLQEDRAPLYDALEQTIASARVLARMWRSASVDHGRFEPELAGDWVLATELADLLVERGVPFRAAHSAVGSAVRWCEEQGGDLRLLDGGAARQFHPAFPEDLGPWLDPRAAVDRKRSRGGTAWDEIERQAEALRRALSG